MTIITVPTTPIEGQKPGTSGLRKKTRVFMQRHYLENFVQAIIDAIGGVDGKTLIIGGDGRFFNDRAAQVILRMCAAQGAAKVIIGTNAILSTPAASNLIRVRGADALEAAELHLASGAPVAVVQETYFLASGVPFNYSIATHEPEHVALETVLVD